MTVWCSSREGCHSRVKTLRGTVSLQSDLLSQPSLSVLLTGNNNQDMGPARGANPCRQEKSSGPPLPPLPAPPLVIRPSGAENATLQSPTHALATCNVPMVRQNWRPRKRSNSEIGTAKADLATIDRFENFRLRPDHSEGPTTTQCTIATGGRLCAWRALQERSQVWRVRGGRT